MDSSGGFRWLEDLASRSAASQARWASDRHRHERSWAPERAWAARPSPPLEALWWSPANRTMPQSVVEVGSRLCWLVMRPGRVGLSWLFAERCTTKPAARKGAAGGLAALPGRQIRV